MFRCDSKLKLVEFPECKSSEKDRETLTCSACTGRNFLFKFVRAVRWVEDYRIYVENWYNYSANVNPKFVFCQSLSGPQVPGIKILIGHQNLEIIFLKGFPGLEYTWGKNWWKI